MVGGWDNISEIMEDVTGATRMGENSVGNFQLIDNLESEVEVMTDYKTEYEKQKKLNEVIVTKLARLEQKKKGRILLL